MSGFLAEGRPFTHSVAYQVRAQGQARRREIVCELKGGMFDDQLFHEVRRTIEPEFVGTAARTNGVLNRFYVLPPGTPRDRVRVLRKAFLDTIKDPEFIADTQRAKLDLDPIDGEEIQKQVRELFKLEPALVAKMKEILK